MWQFLIVVSRSCSIPSIAQDLLQNEQFTKEENSVESVSYGGAAAPPTIPKAVSKLPGTPTDGYVLFRFTLPFSALSPHRFLKTLVVKVSDSTIEACCRTLFP